MGWWSERALPRLIDKVMSGPDIGRRRELTCAGLQGTVLEIGFGSGINIQHYPPAVDRILAVEPSGLAWELAQARIRTASAPVTQAGLTGERLELPDGSVDSVLSTYTLCTIPDVDQALSEIVRVLRPGGSLHFLEHGLAPDSSVADWQRRLQPIQKRIAGGCHLNRRIDDIVARSGLKIKELRAEYGEGPRPLGYLYRGQATQD